MKKQPERTERTRQALIDSFWNLYLTKKIEKITVKEIVTGAGVYRSTFYEYFLDVYDVLETIEQNLLLDFEEASTRTLGYDSLNEALESELAFYEANGERLAHLLGPNGDPGFAAKAMAIIKGNLLTRLNLSQEDIRADLLFDLVASCVITLLNYWYAHRDVLTFRQVFLLGWPLLKNGFLSYASQLDGISGIGFL